jgi:hypothetical protein
MTKGFLYRAVIPILAIGEWIVPASAQFQWPPELSTPPEEARPASPIPKNKQAPKPPSLSVAGPSVTGKWRGELTQVGSKAPYKLELVISSKGGETRYPDLDCRGKLIRVGASKSYAFFIEIITKGAADKGGGAPTVRSRWPERLTILRCYGLEVSTPARSSLTARLRKSSRRFNTSDIRV